MPILFLTFVLELKLVNVQYPLALFLSNNDPCLWTNLSQVLSYPLPINVKEKVSQNGHCLLIKLSISLYVLVLP